MTSPTTPQHWISALEQLGPLEKIWDLPIKEVEALYHRHLNPIAGTVMKFLAMNRSFQKAKGAYLYDDKGRRYLDFLSGFGALNLGHEPDEVLKAVASAEGRINICQSAFNPAAAKLAELLSAVTPGDLSRTFFCNSGAEAVEAALKLARHYTHRKVLLSTQGAYHGKTFGALSVSGREKYRKPFSPLVPETETIPYDDLTALQKRLVHRDVAGFIVEPIQGENGVIIPRKGYLKGAEDLCRQTQTLFLVDEIQTGFGRTGKLFCVNHEEVTPDILILSKSLGGGVMPIGAIVTRDEIWQKAYGSLETAFLHSSTFGGNTRACMAGLAAIESLLSRNLIDRAESLGAQLVQGLEALKNRYEILLGVRGKGLMIGLTLSRVKGKESLMEGLLTMSVARRLLKKHGIITAFTLNNLDVLRIAPPLIITEKEIDYFLRAMEETLGFMERFKYLKLYKNI